MIDEVQALRESRDLYELLSYYAQLAILDRQAWLPRRSELPGCEPRKLSRLHGTLIAEGWLEQNTGSIRPGSYRVTGAGLRALKRVGEVTIEHIPGYRENVAM
ncbi:MAG: hypothetical protein EBV06_08215 [Planctomycetia bacterium]|nr:hypothetical protein [Planctomycetia bacterium]